MSHFAEIKNGIVQRVIVIEPEMLATGHWGDPANWVQTSYRTHGGKHPEGKPLRFNYAGRGYSYDKARDAFIPPKPYASWVLDEAKAQWKAPKPMPVKGAWQWDELVQNWVTAQGMP